MLNHGFLNFSQLLIAVSITKCYIYIIFLHILILIYFFIIYLALSDYSLFPLNCLPKDFLLSMYDCSRHFSEIQIQTIENNIERFFKVNDDTNQLIELQYHVAKTYVNKYKIKQIDSSQKIVGQSKLQVN